VAQGLQKRPPTRHIKKIAEPVLDAYIHTINRDENERYIVMIADYDLRVFDEQGNEKVVNFPEGKAYLNTALPSTAFQAVTVADYTFFVNKTVKVALGTATSPTRPYEALVVVKNGLYGKTYKVTIDGEVFSYSTPDGSTASQSPQISTDNIASQLVTEIMAGTTGVTATHEGAVIYLTSSTDFTLKTEDGYANAAMFGVKGQIQRFSDLPNNAYVQDYTVEIVGDKTSEFDNYWVKFDKSSGSGVWRETIKPGINLGLSKATMPWALVREANGSFTFKTLSWVERKVGDDGSAPHPSFVGRAIQDIFFYRNRLGFIADESVVFSEAGEFFNLYPTTVTDLLDSDRIDVSASHVKVSNLAAAVPFSKQLLLFSAQTQFVVDSGDLLTPRTVSIKPTTEFECDPSVRPVGIGKVVFFATPRGKYSGIREYFVDSDLGTNDATEVTSHVPKYVPANIKKLAVALNEDTMCVLSGDDLRSIYVYRFYWSNNEKLQSSWSKWTFGPEDVVMNADFIQSRLQLLIQRNEGVYLETLDLSEESTSEQEPYLVHLDRKKMITTDKLTYANGQTTFAVSDLGYYPDDGEYVVVVANTPLGAKAGTILKATLNDTKTTVSVPGNFTSCDLILGRKYAFRYQFSTIVPKIRSANGGERADSSALLQLRNMQVNYADTGFFQARVTPQGRPTFTYTFSGKILGLSSATLGATNLETGKYRFPIMSQNTSVKIELYSDSPLPCAFLSADWEGFYAKRSQGI
jgi:hypothetical protein